MQFDKFPSADYEMLEAVNQNDPFINFRAFNKYEGSFVILKYIFLNKRNPDFQVFLAYFEAISNNTELFVQTYNVFYEDSIVEKPDPDDITFVLLMQNNMCTLRQLVEERRTQYQPYIGIELHHILYKWVEALINLSDKDIVLKTNFNLNSIMVTPNIVVPDLEHEVMEVRNTYSYKFSCFDSFNLPCNSENSESFIVKSLSQMIFDLMGIENGSFMPENFNDFPSMLGILKSMAEGEVTLIELKQLLEGVDRVIPNEDQFLPLNPLLQEELVELERVKTLDVLSEIYGNICFYASALKPAYMNLTYYRNLNIRNADLARALNDVGVLYWRLRKYGQAKDHLLESLSILKEIYGENHMTVAILYNNLGLVFEDLNDPNEALRYMEMSYKIKAALESVERLPITLNNLAIIYDKTGLDEEKAKSYLENAIDIKGNFGSKPTSLAISLNNLAVFYANRGNFDKALEYQEKENQISNNLTDENYVISLNNLAYINFQKGLINDALNQYSSAAIVISKQNKNRSEVSAAVLSNYAMILFKLNDFHKASVMLEKATDIKEEIYGLNHMSYIVTTNNLAETYMKLERYEDAIKYLTKSITANMNYLDQNDRKLLIPLNNLAYAYIRVKNLEQAEEWLGKALKIDGSDLATLNNWGLLYSAQEKFKLAITAYEEALKKLQEIKQGENNEEGFRILSNMAAIYVRLKDYEKAEELLKRSLDICQELDLDKPELNIKTKERLDHIAKLKERFPKDVL